VVAISAITPDLSARELTLAATGPGRFEGDLAADQVGSYLLHVTQSAGGAVKHTSTFGVVVPYSPEYRELGTDLNSLRAVARAGGGTVITDVDAGLSRSRAGGACGPGAGRAAAGPRDHPLPI